MGNEHSNIPGFEPLQPHEQFQASILLIDAPPAFHGFDLSEKKWLLLRSIGISIVRWDSKRVTSSLTADQLRLVLNKHAAVVIFDSGLGLSGRSGGGGGSPGMMMMAAHATFATVSASSLDPTTSHAIKNLANVLAQVTKGQADRTRYKLIPVRAMSNSAAAAASLFDQDMKSHTEEYVNSFSRRCNISSDVSNRLDWWHPETSDEVGRFIIREVLSVEAGTIPKDLQRPLKSLLADLVESVDAREGHLFESSTLFPISSSANENAKFLQGTSGSPTKANSNNTSNQPISNAKLREKAQNLSIVLRKLALPMLSSTQSHIRFANFKVGVDTLVYMATVVPNTLFVVLILSEDRGVGEGLVRLNCGHFAQHFTHVVTSTSRIDHRVEPLALPQFGKAGDDNSDDYYGESGDDMQ